jgi:hypothetical protein
MVIVRVESSNDDAFVRYTNIYIGFQNNQHHQKKRAAVKRHKKKGAIRVSTQKKED